MSDPPVAKAAPRRILSTADGVVLVVGLVVGAGIFRAPPLVASNVPDVVAILAVWLIGGGIALIGALCYAELASAYPHAGGEYHVLQRAFGRFASFLLGWSRLTVLQTGSIALLSFVFADYAVRLLPAAFGESAFATPLIAAFAIVLLTLVNALGLRQGRAAQYALTAGVMTGLAMVIAAGLYSWVSGTAPAVAIPAPEAGQGGNVSGYALAFVFVLLTYGGWSEAAYISAELRDRQRGVTRTLIWGVAAVTIIYLLTNAAYLAALGIAGMASSSAVAVDVMESVAGTAGAAIVGVIVMAAALSSANATMITGARSNYAVGNDVSPLAMLGVWSESKDERDSGAPRRALAVQCVVSLLLVLLGAATRAGFETMVAYTAPVFWLTLFLMGVALFVLRSRDPLIDRPFRVPLYPVLPALFCLTSVAMLWSSIAYAGRGALLGCGVMLAGVPVFLMGRARARRHAATSVLEAGSTS
jgi:amino acid transporter